jgi:tetratricopeptide (TPR) repeat protein
MNRILRLGLTALVFVLSLFQVVAGSSWQDELNEAEVHFINGRYDASTAVLDRLLSVQASDKVTSEMLLIKGSASLWKGRIALALDDEDDAESLLLSAIEAAEMLREDDGSGEETILMSSYLLEAEARAELMLFKGVAVIIKNGPLVQELAEKTLEIDPLNPEALVIYAQGRINAPRLFGGNKKEGIRVLEDLWLRRPGGRGEPEMTVPQAYRVAVSLGETMVESDSEAADRYFRSALILAPGSPRAREGLESLR